MFGIKNSIDVSQIARLHMTWSTSRDRTIWDNVDQVKMGHIIKFSYKKKPIKTRNHYKGNKPKKNYSYYSSCSKKRII